MAGVSRLVRVVCISLVLLGIALSRATGREEAAHGGRNPHERFRDEHYKDGKHVADKDHQAILGSKKTAAEFDELSPDEAKKRLRVLAQRMDVNRDGFIDETELQNWIYNSLAMLDAEEADEQLEELDTDHDGKISWKEYRDDAFGEEEMDEDGQEEQLDWDDKQLMAEDKRYFEAADRDSDGFLSKEEFGAFQTPENHPHMHETLIRLTLKEKDGNGDGVLSLKEFIGEQGACAAAAAAADGEGAARAEPEWYESEKDRFENEFDKNKDGKLDRDEMMEWLVPDLDETARDEAAHLVGEADADKDGKLSIAEIVAEHELFVGSEATNYGEDLEKMSRDEL